MELTNNQCLVIKIGSALLVDEQQQCVNMPWLLSLVEDLVFLTQKGIKIVLVSSGAVAYGKLALNITNKQLSLDDKQAASAVGQIQLMHTYQELFQQENLTAAQVLLNLDDTEDRKRYINLRNTLKRLINMNIIPIINENDSIATTEIRYGDNDRLAARVAQMVDADALVLLSDIDGFYTDDPTVSSRACLIPEVTTLSDDILAMAKNSSSNYGSGGMVTKLAAAKIAMNSGCHLLITAGKPNNPLQSFMQTKKGTWFHSSVTPQKAKKIWLQQHLKSSGKIIIDEGAAKALSKGASLLAVGIISIEGHFSKGAAVSIVREDGNVIAIGLINYSDQKLDKIIGKSTAEMMIILGDTCCHEIIHRDNLAMLG